MITALGAVQVNTAPFLGIKVMICLLIENGKALILLTKEITKKILLGNNQLIIGDFSVLFSIINSFSDSIKLGDDCAR